MGNSGPQDQIARASGLSVQVTPQSPIVEGDTAIVSITMNPPSTNDTQIGFTIEGEGITAADYTLTLGDGTELSENFITIPAGASTATITFTMADDSDGTETLIFTVQEPTNGQYTLNAMNSSVRIPIAPRIPELSVLVAPQSPIVEGDTATVSITMAPPSTNDIQIGFTIGGMGITAADYTLTMTGGASLGDSSITIPAGVSTVLLTFTMTNDTDNTETIAFTLQDSADESYALKAMNSSINIPIAVRPPLSPSALTSTSAGSGMSTLSWAEPADTEFSHVLINWSPNGPASPVSVTKGTTDYAATGLNNTTEYTFSVRSVGAHGSQSEPTETTAIPGICGDLSPSNMPVFAGRDSSIISSGTGGSDDPFIIHLSDNCTSIDFAWNLSGLSDVAGNGYIRFANLKDNQVGQWRLTLLGRNTGVEYAWASQRSNGQYSTNPQNFRSFNPLNTDLTEDNPPQSPSNYFGLLFTPTSSGSTLVPQGTFRIGVTP